jgi:hypothetical protein
MRWAIILASFWWASGAIAQSTGNKLYAACKRFATPQDTSIKVEPFDVGLCAGIMEALLAFDDHCIPQTANLAQMTRVVVAYMDRHPDKMHIPLPYLAKTAFTEAWSCRH